MSIIAQGRFCGSPVVIVTGTNDQLRWRDVGAATSYTAVLAAGTYFVRGDVASDAAQTALPAGAKDLLWAIKTALDAAASAIVFTVSVSHAAGAGQGKVTISGTAAFNLLWTDALTTCDDAGGAGLAMGFVVSADDTGASSYTSDNQAYIWYPNVEGKPKDEDELWRRSVTVAASGPRHVLTVADYEVMAVEFYPIEAARTKIRWAGGNTSFQNVFRSLAAGEAVLYYPDNTDDSDVGLWVLDDDREEIKLSDFAVLTGDGVEQYRITIPLAESVAET